MKYLLILLFLFIPTLLHGVCPALDTVWFYQETLRDGQDIILVCYRVDDPDGDSILVTVTSAICRTDTIPVYPRGIIDTVSGYPPPNVNGWLASGEHCFAWNIGWDAPNIESCELMIRLSAYNQSTDTLIVADSFELHDAEGITFDGSYIWVSRSTNIAGENDSLSIYRIDPTAFAIVDSCNFDGILSGLYADMCWHNDTIYMMKGGNPPVGDPRLFVIDPTSCTIIDSSGPLWAGTRWGQGICWHDGYLWINDSHGDIYRVLPYPPYTSTLWLAVDDTFRTYHSGDSLFWGAVSADGMTFAMGGFWILRNATGAISYILFQVDTTGQVVDSFALPGAGTGPEGLTFDGECFWYADHTLDRVYRVCTWSCYDTIASTGCFDTYPPRVSVDFPDCPDLSDTFFVGDEETLTVSLIDSFETEEQCSVFWFLPGEEEQFLGVVYPDSEFVLVMPDISRPDTITFFVAGYDSFGNRGTNLSCSGYLIPCRDVLASVDCPGGFSYTSCYDQNCYFTIVDTTGFQGIDTTQVFARRIIHHISSPPETTAISTSDMMFILSGDTLFLTVPGRYNDSDTVYILLDSLRTETGCPIRF